MRDNFKFVITFPPFLPLKYSALLNNIREEIRATHQCSTELLQLLDKLHTGNERETEAMKNEINKMLSSL